MPLRVLVSYGAKTAVSRGVRPLSSLVEHFLGKEEVVGPIPTGGSVIRSVPFAFGLDAVAE